MDQIKMMKSLQKNNPYKLEVEKVIHVATRVGDGTEADPVRVVEHYYDIEGHLLFESE